MMTPRAPILLILLGSLFPAQGCGRDQEPALRWRHLDFPVQSYGGIIRAEEAPEPDVERCRGMLEEEMSRYHGGFLKKVGINTIVLCSKLTRNDQSAGGVADLQNDSLYLDVVALKEAHQLYSVFHHEVFHFIDWSDDRQIDQDPGWSSLNRGFRYGQADESAQEQDWAKLGFITPTPRGFLSWYSTSGIAEDKAEVFCYLLCERELVSRYVEFDKIVEQKVLAIQRIVRAIDREFGDSLWDAERPW